jgi:hypothetical protein
MTFRIIAYAFLCPKLHAHGLYNLAASSHPKSINVKNSSVEGKTIQINRIPYYYSIYYQEIYIYGTEKGNVHVCVSTCIVRAVRFA